MVCNIIKGPGFKCKASLLAFHTLSKCAWFYTHPYMKSCGSMAYWFTLHDAAELMPLCSSASCHLRECMR